MVYGCSTDRKGHTKGVFILKAAIILNWLGRTTPLSGRRPRRIPPSAEHPWWNDRRVCARWSESGFDRNEVKKSCESQYHHPKAEQESVVVKRVSESRMGVSLNFGLSFVQRRRTLWLQWIFGLFILNQNFVNQTLSFVLTILIIRFKRSWTLSTNSFHFFFFRCKLSWKCWECNVSGRHFLLFGWDGTPKHLWTADILNQCALRRTSKALASFFRRPRVSTVHNSSPKRHLVDRSRTGWIETPPYPFPPCTKGKWTPVTPQRNQRSGVDRR